jgi:hypothetical protein
MTLVTWWNRGKNPFLEAANLVAVTVLIVSSFFTADWKLFWAGILIEVSYLGLASLPTHYRQERLSALELSFKRGEYGLDRVLLVVTVAGFVTILFFGFGKHLLDHPWPQLSHAEGWEAGAIWWTGLFLIYYAIKFGATGNIVVDKLIIAVIIGLDTWLLRRAWETMGKPDEHLPIVLGIGACFSTIDFLSHKYHPVAMERRRSRESLYWADIPMLVAVVVLYAYLRAHRDTETPDVFMAGVISCQLLMSNAVFVVMEFGFLGSRREASTRTAGPTRSAVPDKSKIEGNALEERASIVSGMATSTSTDPTAAQRVGSSVWNIQ